MNIYIYLYIYIISTFMYISPILNRLKVPCSH